MEIGHFGIQAMTSGREGHESIGSVQQFYIRPLVPTGRGGMMSPARTSVHCFFFLKNGEVYINVAERQIEITAGSCLIIPKGQVFSVTRFSNDAEGFMGGFHDNFIIPSRPLSTIYCWLSKPIHLDEKQIHYIDNIFKRIYDEWKGNKDLTIIKAYLQALIAELDKFRSEKSSKPNAAESITGKFLEMISNGGEKRFGVDKYASSLYITPGHLTKCVKQTTGKTPIKWIDEAIMSDAKMMLFQTNMQIGEIAEKLGIDDISYFSRKFKMSEGMTPLEFRQLIKKS